MDAPSVSALTGAVLAGLLGGAHCAAMCGGFVTAFSAAAPIPTGAGRLLPMRRLALRQVPHNAGRVATYALLGAIAGGLGGAALGAGDWPAVQRTLYVIANLFLLAVAFAIAGRGASMVWLQRVGAAVFARVVPAVRPLAARDAAPARFALGMLWGLVPCGLVYGVLPIALFSGSAASGALVMLAFGLGTLPNLLALGWLVARARAWLDARVVRYGAAALLAGFAALGIWRALSGSLPQGHGAFCF
jgi:sulfite exporter TauE/SafE